MMYYYCSALRLQWDSLGMFYYVQTCYSTQTWFNILPSVSWIDFINLIPFVYFFTLAYFYSIVWFDLIIVYSLIWNNLYNYFDSTSSIIYFTSTWKLLKESPNLYYWEYSCLSPYLMQNTRRWYIPLFSIVLFV